jgi:hypothetical protein
VHISVYLFAPVEDLHHAIEEVKLFCLLIFSFDLSDLIQSIFKLLNDDIEQGNTYDEDEAHDDSLYVTFWIKVS